MRIRSGIRVWVIAAVCLTLIATAPAAHAEPKRAVQLDSVDYYRDVPTALASGADGNVWFVAGDSLGQLTPGGTVTSYLLDHRAETSDLVADAGGIWFTDRRSIGRLTYSGELTTYAAGLTADPTRLATGTDGTVWFAGDGGRVGTISNAGVITEHTITTAGGTAYLETNALAVSGDGSAWLSVSEPGADVENFFVSLVRVSAAGAVLTRLPRLHSALYDDGYEEYYRLPSLVRGPDGAVWFLRIWSTPIDDLIGVVGRLAGSTIAGTWETRALGQLASGPDGAVWFALAEYEDGLPKLGRLTTAGSYSEYGPTPTTGGDLIGGPGAFIWGANGRGIAAVTTSGTAGPSYAAPHAAPAITAVTPTASGARVLWNPPDGPGVNDYDVEVQPDNYDFDATTTSTTLAGLGAGGGRSYQVSVRARSSAGTGLPDHRIFTTQPDRAAGPAADFTGDGRADVAVWRPSNLTWYVRGRAGVVYGRNGDIPVPADYDGDGSAEIAMFRPSEGTWYIRGRASIPYGRYGDIPVPADYTGDGKTDLAVFRPSNGTWYVRGRAGVRYGTIGDIPVPGSFRGDDRADFTVWRPSNGTWYVKGAAAVPWGLEGDRPLVLDTNDNGRHEIAVYRPTTDQWLRRGTFDRPGGGSFGLPFPGAFDSERGDDLVMFSPWSGTWQIGAGRVAYGVNGDVPV